MNLPKNERRKVETIDKKVLWIYGAPFSGKTYLANEFPDPLMLNTDGNIKFIDSPFIPIKDIVTVEGRMTKRQLAWEVFKDTITELEKKQNDFKTIVVDLVEDVYEYARYYIFEKHNIEHESDSGFGKGWDLVKTEFLSTMKRLMNLDYENIILISHEDTSKDITKKSGDKLTSIKPNINDKCANKLAGMVDIVARVIADDKDRKLSFKTNEVIFGGGRLSVKVNEIPCDYSELMKVYKEANVGKVKRTTVKVENPQDTPQVETAVEVVDGEPTNVVLDQVPMETATAEPVAATETPERKTRTRKPREVVEEAKADVETPVENVEKPVENTDENVESVEKPTRTRRKRAE